MEFYSVHKPLNQVLSYPDSTVFLHTWQGNVLTLSEDTTHYGFVYQGQPILKRQQGSQTFSLYPGMYFCLPGGGQIGGENSCGMVISSPSDRGLFTLGGPVEPTGRFAYIDGGTNSVLIPPSYLGNPCLNALYFPPHCDQTLHTHPSCRIGVVLEGSGEGETPDGIVQLQPGMLFVIPPNSLHKFRTHDASISFVMFHPDSDIGFSHHHNPMLNRTLVDGVSAVHLPQIRTPMERFEQNFIL